MSYTITYKYSPNDKVFVVDYDTISYHYATILQFEGDIYLKDGILIEDISYIVKYDGESKTRKVLENEIYDTQQDAINALIAS
jgi:hypothetical protein